MGNTDQTPVHDGFIFWTPVDKCIVEFLQANLALHELARTNHLLLIATEGFGDTASALVPGAHVVECENRSYAKGNAALNYVRDRDFDYLVRTDTDAIMFDCDRVKKMVRAAIKPDAMVAAGVKYPPNCRVWYMRGACNATARALAKTLRLICSESLGFDGAYTAAIHAAAGTIIDLPLFEINESYTGSAPVWHPKKCDGNGGLDRLLMFHENMEKFGVLHGKH